MEQFNEVWLVDFEFAAPSGAVPEVRCLVKLLPTGEVLSVRVTQSSGNPAYDDAVVRAIEKSSPLPLPSDRDARAAFVPELSFVHRPKE